MQVTPGHLAREPTDLLKKDERLPYQDFEEFLGSSFRARNPFHFILKHSCVATMKFTTLRLKNMDSRIRYNYVGYRFHKQVNDCL